MKSARKTKVPLRFGDLPRDYVGLCSRLLPRPIHDKDAYEEVCTIADAMAGFEQEMSDDQKDYFDLLCTLIESYDAERVTPPDITPVQLLKHLLEEHQMNAADLSRLLGTSRTLGPMILRGERSITAEHARKLGAHFSLPAGAFIE